MNLDSRAYLFFSTMNYNIYQIYGKNAMAYYLCVSNVSSPTYNLFLGIPSIDLEVANKNDIVNEILKVSNKVMDNNNDSIYILPTIPMDDFLEATEDNDERSYLAYDSIYEPIKLAINDAYHLMKDTGSDVVEMINVVKQNENDTKFINWLESNMGIYYKGITYDSSYVHELTDNAGEEGAPVSYGSKTDGMTAVKSNGNAKKLTPHKSMHGFSSFAFILLILAISLAIGIGGAYLLIK